MAEQISYIVIIYFNNSAKYQKLIWFKYSIQNK
jgi:hypothetical protein